MVITVLVHLFVEQGADDGDGVIVDVLRQEREIFFRMLRMTVQRKRCAESWQRVDFACLAVNLRLSSVQVSTLATSSELASLGMRTDSAPSTLYEAAPHPQITAAMFTFCLAVVLSKSNNC